MHQLQRYGSEDCKDASADRKYHMQAWIAKVWTQLAQFDVPVEKSGESIMAIASSYIKHVPYPGPTYWAENSASPQCVDPVGGSVPAAFGHDACLVSGAVRKTSDILIMNSFDSGAFSFELPSPCIRSWWYRMQVLSKICKMCSNL